MPNHPVLILVVKFVEEQAIDRVHRLNQTVDVVVYRLTIAGTVEQRIFDLQEQKRALAEAAIEGKAVAKLSMKDMLNLFKHDAESKWNDRGHENIGARSRVLEPGVSTASGSQGGGNPVPGGHGAERRNTGKVWVKKGDRGAEHAVFGRRW